MATKIASRKAKARKLQDFIRDIFRDIFRHDLEEDDIKSAIMGESGIDIKLTPAARKLIPFDVEAKAQEKLNLNEALKQAEGNASDGRIPTVIFTKNTDKVWIALEFVEFMKLVYPEWVPGVKINKKSVVPLEE